MSEENIINQVSIEEPDKVIIKYKGHHVTLKDLLDKLSEHVELLPKNLLEGEE